MRGELIPKKLYAYGDAETKDLHWRYGSEVLISDDKEKLLRIVNNVYGAGDDRDVVEAAPEEMRRLILRQWGEGLRYYGLDEGPPHPDVVLELYHTPEAVKEQLYNYLTVP